MRKLSELIISPAPWRVVDSYQFLESEWVSVIESANRKLVSVPKCNNAHLIAAAPTLYEALYDILRVVENRLPSQPTLDEIEAVAKAKSALAEASGESEVRDDK